MRPLPWPSLADELAVAVELFGERGRSTVTAWLEVELGRVTDRDFAARFHDHLDLPGVELDDYLHRVVHTRHGELLGGIRFRGRDVNRPFVEIIAHGFDGDRGLDRLRDCVRDEWSLFHPAHLRLCSRPGRVPGPHVVPDHGIYAARFRDLRAAPSEVSLRPFLDAEVAVAIVARRYERLAVEQPDLARHVSPAASDDIRHWHDSDQLRAIMVGGVAVGALAVAPGHIRWLDGDEINEEVIDADHRGHGYAALAQAAWATCVAHNPDRLLIGTIDDLNAASLGTAGRAGRRRVLERVFVSL